MRTTVTIDDEIMEIARNLARVKGVSVGKALSLLARRGLAAGTEEDTGNDEYPVFSVAESSPSFGTEDVANALNEE